MNKDPYKVLNIEPGATKREIKEAYNKLVKKYHPDYYKEKHMKELAEQKMKEINEAYDYINHNHGSWQGDYDQDYHSKGTSAQHGSSGYDYHYIRNLIQSGRFSEARNILNDLTVRDAQWFYLMGVIEISSSNYNQGRVFFEKALRLDPENPEYQAAYRQTVNGYFFSRRAGHARTDAETCCQVCATLWCLDCCCECSGGDLITCC
ncbi:MAG: DnaJ domain-containing protein [Thermotogota bacterium]